MLLRPTGHHLKAGMAMHRDEVSGGAITVRPDGAAERKQP